MKNLNTLPLINYSLTLHCPAATSKAKEKENRLTAEAGAEQGTIKVQQEKIPECWHKPIKSVQNKVRNFFDEHCFRLNNSYGLPVQRVEWFEAELQKLENEHAVHVNNLCEAIESGNIQKEASRRAGTDYNPALLPTSCETVRDTTYIEVTRNADMGSPAIADALAQLAEDTRKEVEQKLRDDAAKAEAAGQTSIVGYVMGEVSEFLKDIGTRCDGDSKGKKYQTLLDKFVRITEQLPAYNVTNNPEISKAIQKVYDTFKNLNKDALRKDEKIRKEAQADAKGLLSELKGKKLF